MNQIIDYTCPIALYLMILFSGAYAGIHLSGMMNPILFGIIDFKGNLMDSVAWANSWQITDRFMAARMGVFGPMLLWGYVITLILFIKKWRSTTFWLIFLAFALFIADVALTIQQQIPINKFIQSLDFQKLSNSQIQKIKEIHPQVIQNFRGREIFSLLGFMLMALVPFLMKFNRREGSDKLA
jgi:hypothetical protein